MRACSRLSGCISGFSGLGDLTADATFFGTRPSLMAYVGKLGGYVLRHVLEAYDLTIPVVGCGTLHGTSSLIPSAHGRAERVGEAYVVSMGVDLLEGLGVAIDDLA